MSEQDYFYYKERCQELESELAQAKKEISRLSKRINEVQSAVRSRNYTSAESTLNRIAWIAYDWKDVR